MTNQLERSQDRLNKAIKMTIEDYSSINYVFSDWDVSEPDAMEIWPIWFEVDFIFSTGATRYLSFKVYENRITVRSSSDDADYSEFNCYKSEQLSFWMALLDWPED